MATEKDVQDLLRLLTTGRNKIAMTKALRLVKTLQSADLRTIPNIASTNLTTLKSILNDEKIAKSLLTACKTKVKDGKGVVAQSTDESSIVSSKRQRSQYELLDQPQTPFELEVSLSLPFPSTDENVICSTIVHTNRAPLLMAFAVQLLQYTMPTQPLSSRLSLAQAVASLNSNSQATTLGLRQANTNQMLWGPKIKIMTRQVKVLKRNDYNWKAEEKFEQEYNETGRLDSVRDNNYSTKNCCVSKSIISKKSIFIARSIKISSPSDAEAFLQKIFIENPSLKDASHNIVAWRVQIGNNMIENSRDDGEASGGQHLLSILRDNNLSGFLLMVTRWYGGILLGPDRWRIMTEVCQDCLSQRLEADASFDQEALWGLNLDETDDSTFDRALPIFKPEKAKNYLLNSFPSSSILDSKNKRKSKKALDLEKEENLGLLLGALDILFNSWAAYLTGDELDRRAWTWYIRIRPQVEAGLAGWGRKGDVRLSDIVDLRKRG